MLHTCFYFSTVPPKKYLFFVPSPPLSTENAQHLQSRNDCCCRNGKKIHLFVSASNARQNIFDAVHVSFFIFYY
ncbi:hypothetical protein AX774_g2232 [Zancudomyces culisetae]|uniref:Uncharacterized protein n=1 Tax=Zancudomyces culisetae TaxID=1213189 RepID=A0A1R1PTH2_ZANCU|nr:hypothetical protein AX774_g2232 [Zancudomyces culisetae]|eukprot:OMH84251.1 hypothetical protein AX774_g2232 [Zancudomyces culisetae]